MPKTFQDVKAKAERDPAFLAELIVNPKKALQKAHFELTDSRDINRLELFVRTSQENVNAAGKIVGLRTQLDSWGIGASCCNGRLLMPGPSIRARGNR